MRKDLVIPEIIDDEFIIKHFVIIKENKVSFKKGLSIKWFNNHRDIFNYLKNRYPGEYYTYIETVYRIFYNINRRPTCKYCNGITSFLDFQHGYQTYCCSSCANSDPDKISKQELTCLLHYGVKNPHQNSQIIEKAKQICIKKYGAEFYTQTDECKEKVILTNLIKYGVKSHNSLEYFKEKRKETLLNKYGVENPSLIQEVKEKKEQTMLKHFGVKYSLLSEEIRKKYEETNLIKNGSKTYKNDEKIKETTLSKYGVKNISLLDEIKKKKILTFKNNYDTNEKLENLKKKALKTSIDRYGYPYFNLAPNNKLLMSIKISSKNVQEKIIETKRKNKSFNTSSVEEQFTDYLIKNFPNDFECQYRYSLYPFNCDFYIKSLDLYIEIQGSWTHGYHPYNPNNIEDINKANNLLEKALLHFNISNKKSYYIGAYNTWTITDPKKRLIAKENNLNYLEVFSCKVDDVINELNECIKNKRRI